MTICGIDLNWRLIIEQNAHFFFLTRGLQNGPKQPQNAVKRVYTKGTFVCRKPVFIFSWKKEKRKKSRLNNKWLGQSSRVGNRITLAPYIGLPPTSSKLTPGPFTTKDTNLYKKFKRKNTAKKWNVRPLSNAHYTYQYQPDPVQSMLFSAFM